MRQKLVLVLLSIILLIGLWLRIQGALWGYFAYTYDVGRDLLAVNQIIHNFKLPLIGATTGMEGVFYGPWWYYILVIPFILAQGDPSGISLFMALLGVATVILSFLVGRKISGDFLGLVLAALVSFSPSMISSQIWNPYLVWPFIILMFYFIALCYEQKTKRKALAFLLVGLCMGFIFDSEIFFGMLFCLGTFLGLIITLRKSFKINLILSLIGGFLIVLSPRIVFDLRHHFLISYHFFLTLTHGIPQTHYTPFISRISMLKDLFWEIWQNTFVNNIVVGGLLLIAVVLLLFISFRKSNKLEKNFLILSLVILLTFFVYFSTNSTDIFSHYIIGIPLILLFIFSIIIAQAVRIRNGKAIVAVILITVFSIYLSPAQIKNSFNRSYIGDASVYKNELAVIDYVYREANGRQFTTQVFTPNGINKTYQYLFLWYGTKKYYLPADGARLAYYIIEPDVQFKNYRQQIWLNEHKNEGKVVKTQKFNGDVIVQTRVF